MKLWINVVWKCRQGALHQLSMLVQDSFQGHTTPGVKAEIRHSSDLIVIPVGMMKVL